MTEVENRSIFFYYKLCVFTHKTQKIVSSPLRSSKSAQYNIYIRVKIICASTCIIVINYIIRSFITRP